MGADEDLLDKIAEGVSGFTELRHQDIQKATRPWGKDTSATDKALRNCVLGSALGVVELLRVKRADEREALTEVSNVGFSGYAIGRGLLGTELARPSYSQSPAEERDNAIRIHDRSTAWTYKRLMEAFSASELLMEALQSQAGSWYFGKIVGAKKAKPVLLESLVGCIAFAMAEEDLFGPFYSRRPADQVGPHRCALES